MSIPPLRIQDIGEQGLLERVQRYCPTDIVGDDAAVIPFPAQHHLVTTTDLLIDGVHFSDRTMSGFDVGWKAATANLSDLAAMGASPLGLTVGLALPPECPVAWVDALYQGLVHCLAPYQTPILGGDICRSSVRTVSITALGTAIPNQAILRSQAQPGDLIFSTGIHGAAKAGLELLLNPDLGQSLSDTERTTLIEAHQRPKPRLDLTSQLRSQRPASAPPQDWRIAGMDSSDGLADAILQICRMSGVGAQIERSHLPQPSSFGHWLSEAQALEWCLYGGEDYELVLTMSPILAQELHGTLEQPLYPIGQITAARDVLLIDSGHTNTPIPLNLAGGFQHFGSNTQS